MTSGQWLLYRHDPRREGNPPQLDSRAISRPVADFLHSETRFSHVQDAEVVQHDVTPRREMYEYLAKRREGSNVRLTPTHASSLPSITWWQVWHQTTFRFLLA